MDRSVETEWDQEVWRGTLGEFAGLVSRAVALIPGDDVRFRAAVSRGGDDLAFRDPAEFGEFVVAGGPPLRKARSVRLSLDGDVRLAMTFWRSWWMPAATFSVSGRDPVAVNGIASEVRREGRENAWPFSLRRALFAAWAVGLAVSVADFADRHSAPGWVGWVGPAIEFGAVAGWFLIQALFPRLELADPGAPNTAADRIRRGISGSGRTVLTLVVGGLIYAVIDRLI